MRFVLPILLLFVFSVAAQDGAAEKADTQVPPSAQAQRTQQSSGKDLFLRPEGRLLLTGFRDYDYLWQDRCDSIAILNQRALDVELAGNEESESSAHRDSRLAEFHMQLSLGSGGSTTFVEQIGRFILNQALQFGYQYARERVRAQSLSEMDYLYLPQGPGMIRTFGEVGSEALFRGETQSIKIWRDYHESRKNRIDTE